MRYCDSHKGEGRGLTIPKYLRTSYVNGIIGRKGMPILQVATELGVEWSAMMGKAILQWEINCGGRRRKQTIGR